MRGWKPDYYLDHNNGHYLDDQCLYHHRYRQLFADYDISDNCCARLDWTLSCHLRGTEQLLELPGLRCA